MGEAKRFHCAVPKPKRNRGRCCRYLVDGKPPANRRAKTVLVTAPDWDVWKVGWSASAVWEFPLLSYTVANKREPLWQ